ncbi:MAG TPA: phage tail protein [Steroidobacteraceae bacterium]|nr:phage tail protein [Steroidobacteraceae bacterium]
MAATATRVDPLLGFNFLVSITDSQPATSFSLGNLVVAVTGSQASAGFSEVSGLDATMEVENYDAGGFNTGTLRFPGRIKWANLVLKRGLLAVRDPSDTSDFWSWLQGYLDGQGVRKDGTITLLDETQSPALVWGWQRGLPAKWSGVAMNAQQSQVVIEQMEIAHEGLTLIQGGAAGAPLISASISVSL